MNTIQDLAKEAGLTTQAVYKRLKTNPDMMAGLQYEKQGATKVYTDDSYRILRGMFINQVTNQPTEQETEQELPTEAHKLQDEVNSLQTEVARLEKECGQMREQLARAEAEAAAARELVEVYKKSAEEAKETIKELMRHEEEMIQTVHAAQVLQMAAQKPTIIQKIRAALTGGEVKPVVASQEGHKKAKKK